MEVVVHHNAAMDAEVHARGTLARQPVHIAVMDVVHHVPIILPLPHVQVVAMDVVHHVPIIQLLHIVLIVHRTAHQDVHKPVLMLAKHKHRRYVQIVRQIVVRDVVEAVKPTVVGIVVCNVPKPVVVLVSMIV